MRLSEPQLERAARALCRERGQDPDANVASSPAPKAGLVQAALLVSPAWHSAAKEIADFLALARAIEEGLSDAPDSTFEQGKARRKNKRVPPSQDDADAG